LQAIYPEHHWNDPRKPFGYWANVEHQRLFMDQLAIKLNIQSPEDWYNVSCKTVIKEGGSFVAYHYNGSLIQGIYLFNTY
jgi:hypothetical protein